MSNEQASSAMSEMSPATNPLRKWPAVFFGGLFSLILGVVVIAWPDRTLLVLVVLIGIQLMLVGLLRLVFSVADGNTQGGGMVFLVGLLGIVAGLFVVRQPSRTLEILVTVVGLYWLLTGLVDVFRSIGERDRDYAMASMAAGVVTAIGGAVVLFWPGVTLQVLAIIVGLTMIISGLVQVGLSMQMRKA
ncbi:MAG: HdeD family acid-resistance protein [Acidimicrobiia bacterium]